MNVLEWLIGALVVAILAMIVWLAVDMSTAETVELRVDEWRCESSETYTYTTFVSVGKTMIPQTHVGRRCNKWGRL